LSKSIVGVTLVLAVSLVLVACSTSTPAPVASKAPAAAMTAAPAAPVSATKAPAVSTSAAPAAIDYPNKPVTILTAMAAGGSTDIGVRIVAAILEKDFGVPVQPVIKAGAGGQVGWTELAAAKPDGYFIGGVSLPHLPAVVVDTERKAAFKQDDLVPLASQAVDPTQIAVSAESPYKTLKDLVTYAKANPKKVKAGIVGVMNDDEVGYLQAVDAAGIELSPVRFNGSSEVITALLGGHVDVTFCTVGDNYVQSKTGKVRVLAVLDKERTQKFFPDVLTMKELGYGELLSSSTRGFAAPKGVPEPVLQKLEASLLKAMKSQEHVTKIEEAGQPVVTMNREEFTKFYNNSFETMKKWFDKAIKDT